MIVDIFAGIDSPIAQLGEALANKHGVSKSKAQLMALTAISAACGFTYYARPIGGESVRIGINLITAKEGDKTDSLLKELYDPMCEAATAHELKQLEAGLNIGKPRAVEFDPVLTPEEIHIARELGGVPMREVIKEWLGEQKNTGAIVSRNGEYMELVSNPSLNVSILSTTKGDKETMFIVNNLIPSSGANLLAYYGETEKRQNSDISETNDLGLIDIINSYKEFISKCVGLYHIRAARPVPSFSPVNFGQGAYIDLCDSVAAILMGMTGSPNDAFGREASIREGLAAQVIRIATALFLFEKHVSDRGDMPSYVTQKHVGMAGVIVARLVENWCK